MSTIQETIQHYSAKLVEQESLKFNGNVATLISNELRYTKKLPHQIYISIKRTVNIENTWVISILASSKPQSGSVETPLNGTSLCKVLTEAGGIPVETENVGEYKFMFSLLPTND